MLTEKTNRRRFLQQFFGLTAASLIPTSATLFSGCVAVIPEVPGKNVFLLRRSAMVIQNRGDGREVWMKVENFERMIREAQSQAWQTQERFMHLYADKVSHFPFVTEAMPARYGMFNGFEMDIVGFNVGRDPNKKNNFTGKYYFYDRGNYGEYRIELRYDDGTVQVCYGKVRDKEVYGFRAETIKPGQPPEKVEGANGADTPLGLATSHVAVPAWAAMYGPWKIPQGFLENAKRYIQRPDRRQQKPGTNTTSLRI